MKNYLIASIVIASALQSGCISTVRNADETTYKNLPYAEGNINYCSSKGAYGGTTESTLKSQLKELKSFYNFDSNYYNHRVAEEEKNAEQAISQANVAEHCLKVANFLNEGFAIVVPQLKEERSRKNQALWLGTTSLPSPTTTYDNPVYIPPASTEPAKLKTLDELNGNNISNFTDLYAPEDCIGSVVNGACIGVIRHGAQPLGKCIGGYINSTGQCVGGTIKTQ